MEGGSLAYMLGRFLSYPGPCRKRLVLWQTWAQDSCFDWVNRWLYMRSLWVNIIILILHLSIRVCVCVCVYFTGSKPTLAQKVLFLYKTKIWHYILWLSDTASNGASSRLNQAFQKRVGQNKDRQTYSPVVARRQWKSNVWDSRLSVLRRGRQFCAGRLCLEFFRAKLLRRWMMSFLDSWLNKSHGLAGCAYARNIRV